MTTSRGRLAALGLCFTGSGVAGLLAEQAFEKLLGTLLGTSTQAGAAVLGTYFGGLTLGGWLYGRARVSRPLRAYAFLEATIALACVVLLLSIGQLVPVFVPLLRVGASSGALLPMRLLVAAAWILPVTVPMGATFPAIVDALDGAPRRGTFVSAFYGLNVLGAVAGAIAGPHLVFPRLGVDGALGTAAVLDGIAAATALAFSRTAAASVVPAEASDARRFSLAREGPLLAVAGISGFVLFSLEVTWSHLIGTVIGNSVYAFATMLTVVLVGLAIGAAIGGLVGARLGTVPAWLPGASLAAAALLLALTHGAWPEAPHEVALRGREASTFGEAEWARATIAVRLLLPPTLALGTVYPLLLRLDAFPTEHGGGVAGRMGATNAIGCIVGALLVGFLVLPAIGSDSTLRLLGTLAAVAGAAVVVTYARGRARIGATAVAVGVAALAWALPRWSALALTSGEHVYFAPAYVLRGADLRFLHEDTAGGFTTVVENHAGTKHAKYLLTNGKFQGDDAAEMKAQDAFALAPMQVVRGWEEALVIGLGTGRTAHTVAAMGYEHITVAEIAPGMVTAARREFAHINGGVLDRPNVRVALEDGRNLLALEPRAYDLVTMEISSVWFANSTNVYSREFYALARSRLRPGGVLQQWFQLHHLATDDLVTMIATFRDVFPCVHVFVHGRQGVLVGSTEQSVLTAEFVRRLTAAARALGGEGPSERAEALAASRLLSPEDVDALVARAGAVVNTDRNRHLEYTTPRFAQERVDRFAENLAFLRARSSVQPLRVAEDATGPVADALRRIDAARIKARFP